MKQVKKLSKYLIYIFEFLIRFSNSMYKMINFDDVTEQNIKRVYFKLSSNSL